MTDTQESGEENFACPECEKEAAADAARNTYGKPQARTIQPEEEAVIEAVRKWMLAAGDAHPGDHGETLGIHCHLCAIAKAFRALQPKPVKPEEVEPGTRFRFTDENTRPVKRSKYQ